MPGRPDPRVDLTSIDLTDADLGAVLDHPATRRAAGLAREALYIGVGLGILGVQRTQVRRRELERSVRRAVTGLTRPPR
ncbi:MAG: hypothetical protein AAFY28_14350 [Actinomycetota bacterium]